MKNKEREIDLFEVAEIKLSYSAKVKNSLRPKVSSSRQVYEVIEQVWDKFSTGKVPPHFALTRVPARQSLVKPVRWDDAYFNYPKCLSD